MDLSDFRKDYLKDGLSRKTVDPNPVKQFEHWFQQALDADYPEPNAMSLATVDAAARPSLRTVLLKTFQCRRLRLFH